MGRYLQDARRSWPEIACWTALATSLVVAIAAWAISTRKTFLVRHENAGDFVALFGDAWSGTTGEFHVAGGRMDGSVVKVSLVGPSCEVVMTLEHVGARQPMEAGDVVIEQADSDVVAVLHTTRGCDRARLAQLRPLAERVVATRPGHLWIRASGIVAGRERIIAASLSVVLYVAIVALAIGALRREVANPVGWWRDAGALAAVVFLGTVTLGEPSIANWYSNLLPASRRILEADDQNGVAGFFLQALFAAIIPWSDRSLFALNLIVHSVAGGIYYVVLRQLAVTRRTAVVAVVVWATLPLTMRLGWSDAQHVYVEVLFALMLLAWLRAQRQDAWQERMLVPMLALLLPLVRLEALALALVPLFFGVLVGDRPGWRRVVDAFVYLVSLAFASALILELFVRRYEIPVPDAHTRLQELLQPGAYLRLLRQFVHVESGMTNWMPIAVTALMALGAAVLALRRFPLLVVLVIAIAVPQLVLGRQLNAEGTVGARYFLPLLLPLALLAATGASAIATAVARSVEFFGERHTRWVAPAVMGLTVAAVVGSGLPLYHFHYAFQDELGFLRAALERLPPDARVYHLPVREDDAIRADPDCCLDLPRSPLALAFPAITFEPIPIRGSQSHLPAARTANSYYYQGALCRLAPTVHSEGRNPGLSAKIAAMCVALANDPRLELVAEAERSANGFWQFLEPGPVPLRLYRVVAPEHADE